MLTDGKRKKDTDHQYIKLPPLLNAARSRRVKKSTYRWDIQSMSEWSQEVVFLSRASVLRLTTRLQSDIQTCNAPYDSTTHVASFRPFPVPVFHEDTARQEYIRVVQTRWNHSKMTCNPTTCRCAAVRTANWCSAIEQRVFTMTTRKPRHH